MTEELVDQARRWLDQDPDADTRAELTTLLDAEAYDEIADRFGARLEFGTAGLRAAMGAGPARMNRVVVMRAAAGLARYLQARGGGAVVVGYDARHKSATFAEDTVSVMQGAGLRASLLSRPLPTPVLAFAIRQLGCAAGVMVTASHNPAHDNGYKVYLGDGSQIVPPADRDIAAFIDAVGDIREIPRRQDRQLLDEDVVEAYLDAVAALAGGGPRNLRMAYTPLHGVGGALVQQVLSRAGFAPPAMVAEQAAANPDFPTVPFPNPEEPGAMDLVLTLARQADAELALANDPDADRCAVAVPTDAGWRLLSGDEVGCLLADFLLRSGVRGTYATTIVSSSLLASMAALHSVAYAETLTGFKWLSKVPGLVYGYEEALGYCVAPELVRDKDGISALLLVAELAAELRAQGRTLLDRLDELSREHGHHATSQLSVRVASQPATAAVLSSFRQPPTTLGGCGVERVEDLASDSTGLPPTPGVRLWLADSGRVVVRPSGTEPKLKCYVEVVVDVGTGSVGAARELAEERLAAIRADLAAVLARSPGSSS